MDVVLLRRDRLRDRQDIALEPRLPVLVVLKELAQRDVVGALIGGNCGSRGGALGRLLEDICIRRFLKPPLIGTGIRTLLLCLVLLLPSAYGYFTTMEWGREARTSSVVSSTPLAGNFGRSVPRGAWRNRLASGTLTTLGIFFLYYYYSLLLFLTAP